MKSRRRCNYNSIWQEICQLAGVSGQKVNSLLNVIQWRWLGIKWMGKGVSCLINEWSRTVAPSGSKGPKYLCKTSPPKVIWEESIATPYDREWNCPFRVLLAAQYPLQTNPMPHTSLHYTMLSNSPKELYPFPNWELWGWISPLEIFTLKVPTGTMEKNENCL